VGERGDRTGVRYYFDTEFDEDGRTIELISICVVADDGREFYRVSSEFDPKRCNDWVKQNVLPQLPRRSTWVSRESIARDLLAFVGDKRTFLEQGQPEFWAYYADYDWVALCQLYGRMIDLPQGWPMYCRDLKQWCDDLGNPELPEQGAGEHDALEDARWNSQLWGFLSLVQMHQAGQR
jgi:hypothetical protein